MKYSADGGNTWLTVTDENFPTGGIDVLIPYPEGSGKEKYDFLIGHLILTGEKAGTMEYFFQKKKDRND
ncbi:MAG: hypothetical protein HFH93_11850 [Lachnospiraceae bacterium]|nr:hypothetical protein [Lachnospiraceae bacterium]